MAEEERHIKEYLLEISCMESDLFLTLAKKCHDPQYEVPPETGKKMDELKLSENGEIRKDVQDFVLHNVTLRENDKFSIM